MLSWNALAKISAISALGDMGAGVTPKVLWNSSSKMARTLSEAVET
jgi:hypothetical protein